MSRSRIVKFCLKQVVAQTTLLNYRIFQRKHRKIIIKQHVDKYSLYIQRLAQLDELDELLAFSQEVFTGQQQYLAHRIQELLNLCAEDEEVNASASSLKSMLLFLLQLCRFNSPSITVNEEGLFHLDWERNDFYSMTLRFRKDNSLDYVVFLPNQRINQPIILHGNMNILDFKQTFIEQHSLVNKLVLG